MSENEKVLQVINDFADGLEAIAVKLKREIAEIATAGRAMKKNSAVPEQVFTFLKFESHSSEKLKDFETADRKTNTDQNWIPPFNILKAANATINDRYHGPDYVYSYWLYQDRVFRQKPKQK